MNQFRDKILTSGPFGKLVKQLLSFGIIGVINTMLGVVLIELFYNIFHWNYWVSSITSYVIGSIYSFFANKRFTFQVKGDMKRTGMKFAINMVICYSIAYGIAKPLVRVVLGDMKQSIVENIALLVGMGLFIVLNFFGQKFFVFKDSDKQKGLQHEENCEE